MARTEERQPIYDFGRGLIQARNLFMVPPGAALDMDNVSTRYADALTLRRGRTQLMAAKGEPGTFLGQLRRESGRYMLLAGYGSTGDIDKYTGPGTQEKIGQMTPGLPVYAIMYPPEDVLILGDGQLMKKFDGTTFSDVGGSPPKLRCLELYDDRIWGILGRLTLRASGVGDSSNWDPDIENASAYEHEIDSPEGSPGTAVYHFGDYLGVWTQNRLYELVGDATWNYRLVLKDRFAGCYSHFSVAEVNGACYWHGPGGIWERYRGMKPRLISEGQIDDIIEDADPNRVDEIAASVTVDGRFYRLSLPGITEDRTVIFDTKYRSWSQIKGVLAARYMLWRMP